MDHNPLRERWATGRTTINGWLSIPSGVSAEVMAHQTFDSLTIDTQHGLIGYETALSMLQALGSSTVVPLVRVPAGDSTLVMKLLDAGALGVICPMVNTADDAHSLVRACRYPPAGLRSVGPTRAGLYYTDYIKRAAELVLVIAQIETAEAVANIEEIISVPGLDAVYVGPADLALSMGGEPTLDQLAPDVLDAITVVARAARSHGVAAGIHCGSAAYARRMAEAGFSMVTLQSDVRLLISASASIVAEFASTEPSRTRHMARAPSGMP